ncbi:MAG: pyridoxine 5'-phosphate synthase [Deltaproteobacteria bacterium]|nr:pyridoxine 5'-phosphate synthase [Deltaproteobacteria bacterium]
MVRRRLGFNIDHVATIRQKRHSRYPDPVTAASVAELAGADQINLHLREDRRHMQERDLRILRDTVQSRLNLVMSASIDMVKVAYELKPNIVTLVPERRDELTTEGGLDVNHHKDTLKKYLQNLRDGDIQVSLFIEPDLEQVRAAHRLDSNMVELYTGKYCDARDDSERRAELTRIADAARAARKLGMSVAAGHGLNYTNIRAIIPIEEIEEYNIGHSIISRALFSGLEPAVKEMLLLLTL